MQQNRLFQCPEPLQGGETYLTVLFCIPNTEGWRRTVSGMVSLLGYGRAWDSSTGNIIETTKIGREIFDTMAMCDLQTELEGIRIAIETIADNTPRLYTIQEILDLENTPGGINFQELEAFLNILGFLPGIKIDPLSILFQFLWRAKVLGNMYTQSAAQTAMAGALTKGLGLEAILGTINVADQATDEILDIINSGSNVLQTLFAGLELFKDENNGSQLKVINDIVLNLEICPMCGQQSCHCNPELDGQTVDPQAVTYDPCQYPTQFETQLDYEAYICRMANWVADKWGIGIKSFQLLYNAFYYDYIQLKNAERLGVMEVYRRMAMQLDKIFDPLLIATLTNQQRSEVITVMTNHYLAFQDEIILTVPETKTFAQVENEFWNDPFQPVSDYWQANINTVKQDLYEAELNTEFIGVLLAKTSDAIGASLSQYAALIGDTLALAANNALANMRGEKVQTFVGYTPDYQCTGVLCTCPEVWVIHGAGQGGGVFLSANDTLDPNLHHVSLRFNYDLNGIPGQQQCGPSIILNVNSINGFTPWPTDAFQLRNTLGQTIYCEQSPPPAFTCCAALIFSSTTPFTLDISYNQGDCTEGPESPC